MKITKTIIYNLPGVAPLWGLTYSKMERKLQLLETYSSRSRETHLYFAEDNLEQTNFHCWYRVASIKIEKKMSIHTIYNVQNYPGAS